VVDAKARGWRRDASANVYLALGERSEIIPVLTRSTCRRPIQPGSARRSKRSSASDTSNAIACFRKTAPGGWQPSCSGGGSVPPPPDRLLSR